MNRLSLSKGDTVIQIAQLLQRGHAMLDVTEYFAKSLKIT